MREVINMEFIVARLNTGSDDQSNYRKMHVALRKIAGYACLGCCRARFRYPHMIG